MGSKHLACLIALALVCLGLAQTSPSPRIGKAVRSPEVGQDGRVTFRFRAPNAKTVSVVIEGAPGVVVTKDAKGIWSGTTDVLQPDLYVYSFVVDGVALDDPANPLVKPIATGGAESIVQVTGKEKQIWEDADVPHGTLHRLTYESKILGERRQLLVYTPPGYDPGARKRYPVLYLLHGVMETCDSWVVAGRADAILDNLIAQRKAEPMLIVMPLGYGFSEVPDNMGEQFDLSKQKRLMDAMGETLLEEVVPRVERAYKVLPTANRRAIAGCSMGGAQALYIGLNHADRFGFIGSLSGAFIMYSGPLESWFPNPSENRGQGLVVACGKDDFLLNPNRKLVTWLVSKGIHPVVWETPGGHTWNVWRRDLIALAPLLFK